MGASSAQPLRRLHQLTPAFERLVDAPGEIRLRSWEHTR
jgi:hypothetical protein